MGGRSKVQVASRWIIFIPAAWLALFASPVEATYQQGLNATGYLVSEIPPLRDTSTYPVCGETVYPNINWTWDYEENHLGECGWDQFMVHYQGFITIPDGVTSVRFAFATDDGGVATINGYTFGRWQDQGCSVIYDQRRVYPTSEALPIEAWMYENGGGTCAMLFWQLNGDDQDWSIVPEWAFTTESTPPTTTSSSTVPPETVPVTDPATTTVPETTVPETTVPVTTTTVQQTTTSVTTTSTTVEPSTSTVEIPESTTSSVPPSSSVPTDTLPPSTSTTQEWVPPPQTTEPAPVVTEPPTVDTEAPAPIEEPEEVPDTSWVEPIPVEEDNPNVPVMDVEPEPTLPPDAPESPISDDVVEEVSNSPETLLEALESSEEITAEAAVALATSPEVLAVASGEQAAEIFQALDVSELSNTEVAALIEAVQEAPLEVREAFEEEIDIFKSGLDTYVPIGSNVPVAVRRTLIAAGAALTVASSSIRRK